MNIPSAVETIMFRGKPVYIKRDDLIDPCLSGNKFRKLYALTVTDSSKYNQVISYGGNQSNAMLSIAVQARIISIFVPFKYTIEPLETIGNPINVPSIAVNLAVTATI